MTHRSNQQYLKEHEPVSFQYSRGEGTNRCGHGISQFSGRCALCDQTMQHPIHAAKEVGTLNAQKWPQFLSECSVKLKDTQDNADAAAPAAKTPAKKQVKETTAKPRRRRQQATCLPKPSPKNAARNTKRPRKQGRSMAGSGRSSFPLARPEVRRFGCCNAS